MFLQGSYAEGFPNALLESCAVGVPVIAFDSPGGHNEIIQPGINGYLVKNEKEFIKMLINIYEDYSFQTDKVRESVTSRYGRDIILSKYEQLLKVLYNKLNLKN